MSQYFHNFSHLIENLFKAQSKTPKHSIGFVAYCMKTKDEAFQKYKLYEAMLNRQKGIQIKTLIMDRGGEYTSTEFNKHLENQGTNHRLTVHDTPESNGVAE